MSVTAQNSIDFKKTVYGLCMEELQGDYFIKVSDLLELNQTEGFWNVNEVQDVLDLTNEIRCSDDREPIVFIPSVEEKESFFLQSDDFPSGCPVTVISDEYNSENQETPSYTLSNDLLVDRFISMNEENAWNSDTWVIGQEENISEVNTTVPYNSTNNRFDGQTEKGGILQVTDLGAVEPWVSGKFEFRYAVLSASGVLIKDKTFDSIKRKKVKNQAWHDFNDFICNWNLSNIGNYMIEKWMELDGGQSASTTITQPPPAGSGGPTVTTTIPSKDRDDDLGTSIVQFSDHINTAYSISHANFKRKN